MKITFCTTKGFKDDPEFLDAAITALHAKCRRIVAEKELGEATKEDRPGVEERRQAAVLARQREEAVRQALDARLALHRAEGGFTLGIDRLRQEADLNEEQVEIVIACFVCAISEDLSASVFEDLDFALYISMSVEGACRVLEASTVADRLRVRRYFEDGGALLRHGFVKLDGRRDPDVPEDLNGVYVKLTERAFQTLVGGG